MAPNTKILHLITEQLNFYYKCMNADTPNGPTLELSGHHLTVDDAERILQGQVQRLALAATARARVEKARRCLERLMATGATIYGVNTGFGKLANKRIDEEELLALQENLLRSHAVGMGALLSIRESRLALTLRIQALAKGHSGVTPKLIDVLIAMYNRGVVPAIPEQGSVGASGDLAPLAHMALVLMGEGQASVINPNVQGRREKRKLLSGRAALRQVKLEPYRPQAKE